MTKGTVLLVSTLKRHVMNDKKIQSKIQPNLGDNERLISVLSGSVLLLQGLMGKKKNMIPALAGAYLLFRGGSGYCAVYDAVKRGKEMKSDRIEIRTSISVQKPVKEVYAFWRRLENLPLFMTHLKSVDQVNETLSEWKAKIPGMPGSISWHAEIVHDAENESIAWHSLPGSDIENAGEVYFRGKGEFTTIDVVISYKAPVGKIGEKLAEWLNPLFEKMIRHDVQNFTSCLESAHWTLSKSHLV